MPDTMLAETVRFPGHGGDTIEGYLARPMGDGPYGAVVVIHHLPGYDRATKEMTRRFADAGFLALCPNLYVRDAPGAEPDDAAALVRSQGGVPDERVVGDVAGAAAYLRGMTASNGKVGVIGHCSGGRHAFLSAASLPLDAAVDCYGAFVVEEASPQYPTMTPIAHLAPQLSGPLLGLFGADDAHPAPEHVAELAKVLSDAGKEFEFHSYDGAGHAFFAVDRPSYRPEAAVDGWGKIFDFFGSYLGA
jgi:carboxymethylenebutenolidase